MKTNEIGLTATTNDHLVRLRIFDGVIPPDDYHREIAELERGQHEATRRQLIARVSELEKSLTRIRRSMAKQGTRRPRWLPIRPKPRKK